MVEVRTEKRSDPAMLIIPHRKYCGPNYNQDSKKEKERADRSP
jgi:hypothetical protein